MARLNPHGLTDKQERFCQEYAANGGNATRAYISAGYATDGAEQNASRLMANDKVQAFIAELRKTVAEKLGMDAEYLLGHLRDIIEDKTNESTKDRIRAIELAGKNSAMWIDRKQDDTPQAPAATVVIMVPEGNRAQ